MLTENQKFEVYNLLVSVAQVFRDTKINQEGLKFYTETLANELSFDEIKNAVMKIAVTKREPFFPSIAEIIQTAKPKLSVDEEANLVANEIIKCVAELGPYRLSEVRERLGSNFAIAESFGWMNLCEVQNSELQTVRAQLRELSKAHLSASAKGISVQSFSNRIEKTTEGLSKISFN